MYIKNNSLWSSFEHDLEITPEQGVVTAFSGSSGDGGHVSLFMEHIEGPGRWQARTVMLDLTSPDGRSVKINRSDVQKVEGEAHNLQIHEGGYERNGIHYYGLPKETASLPGANRRSYVVTDFQCKRLMEAAKRFAMKAHNGRYVYFKPGGGLGQAFSLPGHRGINCADFVLKILNEAGIANRHSLLFNTPKRIAKRRD